MFQLQQENISKLTRHRANDVEGVISGMGVARRPTYADAILDRLVHNAHRVELTAESLRRTRGKQLKTP
jgi:hypothetical protein